SVLCSVGVLLSSFFFFQAEDGIRDFHVTEVQTCALPILGTKPTYSNSTNNSIIYRSTTGTAGSWQVINLNTTGQVELAVAPSNPDVVYALLEDEGTVANIIKTTNEGATWETLNKPVDADTGIPDDDFSRGQAWYDLTAAVNPTNENEIIVGAIDLFRSGN